MKETLKDYCPDVPRFLWSFHHISANAEDDLDEH